MRKVAVILHCLMLLIGMKLSALTFRKAGLEGYYEVRDLWEREDLGSVDKIVTKK